MIDNATWQPQKPDRAYPIPGTTPARMLAHIKNNPGTSKNAVRQALNLNPGVAKVSLQKLIAKGLVREERDERGVSALWAAQQ